MSTHKRVRLLTQYIEDAGLELEAFIDKKDARVTAQAKAWNGEVRLFSLSNGSTGDPRGDLNERSRIRRFAAEVGVAPQMAEKIKEKLPEFKHVVALTPKTVEQAAIMDAIDKLPMPTDEGYLGTTEAFAEKAATAFEEKPTMPEEAPARKKIVITKIKKLTLNEQYTVIEWLKTFDTEQFHQPTELVTHINEVQKLIPVPVTLAFVRDAVKLLGKKFRDRRSSDGEGLYRKDRSQLIARELERMAISLGFEMSEGFKEYLTSKRTRE